MKKENSFKMLLTVCALCVVIAGAFYLYNTIAKKSQDNQVVGGDQDEHGCVLMAGYSWCETEQKCLRPWEEGCEDSILSLFEAIENEVNIDFSEPSNIELTWQVEDEDGVKDLKLQAIEISADTVTDSDFQKIKEAIKSDGFEDDKYNARGGTLGEFGSYIKNNFSLVCALTGIYSDFDPDDTKYEPQTTDKDVKIACAILDKSLVPEISTEKRIKEALAAKYSKKLSQTTISINQETETHVKGDVQFLPGGSENSGMFLAAKVNDSWQIVFDGNGSIACEDLEQYNFPDEMIESICY